jgi:hypothetical protein
MYLQKKIFLIFSFLFIIVISTGCVSPISKQGLVVSLSQNQLSNSFNKSFPINKNFVFGNILIDNPQITMPKNSKRIKAGISLDFTTIFTAKLKGKFSISGEPLFNKNETSIYLHNVRIEEFNFNNNKIGNTFSKSFLSSLQPMVNELFKKYPIYKIPEESFQGTFIKDVKVKNSQLLITYGI